MHIHQPLQHWVAFGKKGIGPETFFAPYGAKTTFGDCFKDTWYREFFIAFYGLFFNSEQ